MASLTVRQLDDALKQQLRLRAARNGRSVEDEVRTILREAAGETETLSTPIGTSSSAAAPYEDTRRVLLIVGGGIAAYKSLDLIRGLKERGIDTLTVVGYMTHNCDDSTVRQAHHEGWKVELLHDATGALPYANAAGMATAEEIHRVFTVVMHSNFAAVADTDAWLSAVAKGEALPIDNVFLSNQRAIAGR